MGQQKKEIITDRSIQLKKIIPQNQQTYSSDKMKAVWLFDEIDVNGDFAFDINNSNFRYKEFLSKMINYSNKTWDDIRKETHDKSNKSKHHYIGDCLSKEAQKRLKTLHKEEASDSIYSFAFNNKLRIIGIRENEKFHVLWYDFEHKVSLSTLKHT